MNRRDFLIGGLTVAALISAGGFSYINRPEFGRLPRGARLEKCQKSPHYKNGEFQNLVPVPVMSEQEGERENKFVALFKMIFGDKTGLVPKDTMLTKKTNLYELDKNKDAVVWMGHSSFFIQTGGYKILIDPVFSSFASPLFFINKAFAGSNIYTAGDIPEIDVLIITHDHWDHLDYPTIMALKEKIKNIVCPLGVGEHFEYWGFDADKLHEEDWYSKIEIADDLAIHILPSQHFSGRFLTANPTLWGSFAIITPQKKIYVSGDGGYGEHFKAIGEKFNGFDLAIMENGQYNLAWHNIHMLPDETARAASDLKARLVIPAHNSKFALARHAWQAPLADLAAASKDNNYKLLTPEIGELTVIDDTDFTFSKWWEHMA